MWKQSCVHSSLKNFLECTRPACKALLLVHTFLENDTVCPNRNSSALQEGDPFLMSSFECIAPASRMALPSNRDLAHDTDVPDYIAFELYLDGLGPKYTPVCTRLF